MSEPSTRKRILSGIQPSGILHLGNYFGAIKQHIELQETSEPFYFIADYHALTTLQDAQKLREYTFDVALTYLSLGLDPEKATLFRQSAVPEVTELTWLLSTVTGMGLLERAVSYKDKLARGIAASVGLFTYPILMASDILIYQSDVVPVGGDQVQHVEIAQDIAQYFNNAFGSPVFKRPEWRLDKVTKVPGVDGQKMSKSYDNTIEIFATGKPLKKRVMGIVTDSMPVEAAKNPQTCNVFALYSLFATDAEQEAMAARYRAGGMGYGEAKSALLEKIEAYFAPYRARREELMRAPEKVEAALAAGAKRARALAQATLSAARKACGID